MPRWTVRFRYIPPYLMFTPLMLIPVELYNVEAETEEQAWPAFLKLMEHPDWFRRETE